MLGQYNKIEAVTYSDGVPTYVLTGWNIPSLDFEVDICDNCLLSSDTNHSNSEVVESNTAMLVNNMDDILKFAEEHDLMDRLQFDALDRLLVGNNRNIAISYLLYFDYINPNT